MFSLSCAELGIQPNCIFCFSIVLCTFAPKKNRFSVTLKFNIPTWAAKEPMSLKYPFGRNLISLNVKNILMDFFVLVFFCFFFLAQVF